MFYIQFKKKIIERMSDTHFLFFGERYEWIAQVAHQKWAMWANRSGCSPKMSDVSESLRSLTKNEQMSELLIFLSESLIHSFLDKKQRFARKSNERIPSPAIDTKKPYKKTTYS